MPAFRFQKSQWTVLEKYCGDTVVYAIMIVFERRCEKSEVRLMNKRMMTAAALAIAVTIR